MQAFIRFISLAYLLTQIALGARLKAEGLNNTSAMSDPGDSCSPTNWCSYDFSRFCGKRRGGEWACYITEGYPAGSTPQFCTLPNHVDSDGNCALKNFEETCEEDSDCDHGSKPPKGMKCSASERKCKYSCLGHSVDESNCPKCHNGAQQGLKIEPGHTFHKVNLEVTTMSAECPNCCWVNGNKDGCCKRPVGWGSSKIKMFTRCDEIRDAMCIDYKCENIALDPWNPDFRCRGTGNNVGQLEASGLPPLSG